MLDRVLSVVFFLAMRVCELLLVLVLCCVLCVVCCVLGVVCCVLCVVCGVWCVVCVAWCAWCVHGVRVACSCVFDLERVWITEHSMHILDTVSSVLRLSCHHRCMKLVGQQLLHSGMFSLRIFDIDL